MADQWPSHVTCFVLELFFIAFWVLQKRTVHDELNSTKVKKRLPMKPIFCSPRKRYWNITEYLFSFIM